MSPCQPRADPRLLLGCQHPKHRCLNTVGCTVSCPIPQVSMHLTCIISPSRPPLACHASHKARAALIYILNISVDAGALASHELSAAPAQQMCTCADVHVRERPADVCERPADDCNSPADQRCGCPTTSAASDVCQRGSCRAAVGPAAVCPVAVHSRADCLAAGC